MSNSQVRDEEALLRCGTYTSITNRIIHSLARSSSDQFIIDTGLTSLVSHMFMIIDMFAAVAALPRTLRAITEIHLRVGLVGNAADCASMKRPGIPPGELGSFLRYLPSAIFQRHDDVPGKEEEEIA